MTTLEILKAGRELISAEERWTKRRLSTDANGETTSPKNKNAVCWCSEGALQKVSETYNGVILAANCLCQQIGGDISAATLILYNDTHTHAEVLAMWDKAIAAEEAKEQS